MSEAIWLPGLIVLAAGLAAGLVLAHRLRSAGSRRDEAGDSDLLLKIRDCEARRDDLYRRLRAAEEEGLGEAERAALENAAARSLQELDRLTAGLPKRVAKKRKDADRPTVEHKTPVAASRHPLLVGFAFGAGMVAVVALLVYWAVRDARPRDQAGAAKPPSQMTETPHEGNVPLAPEIAARIAELEARLDADPEDGQAKKELARVLLAGGRLFEAFEQADEVLERFPEDPDGLLVQGVVRMTMGQHEAAMDLLDRVLAQHPDHRQALLYRGLALYQTGNREQAIDTWEIGLEMAGGSDPDLEELLAMARAGAAMPAAGVPPPDRPAPGPTAPTSAADPDGFRLEIELAPGAVPTPQATLFVFLRDKEGGPPVAARRVASPTFPLQLTLGAADSMMGAELPDAGTLVARLDSDGTASTTSDDDLEGVVSGTKGQLARLVLDR